MAYQKNSGVFTNTQAAQAKGLDKWVSTTLTTDFEGDDNFANTTLLLQGNGSDGGNNNGFIDSSSNAHTITRNGNVTQGSFSPFSVDEGKWGVYFDDSSVTAPSDADFDMTGVSYCFETWLYTNSDNEQSIFNRMDGTGGPGMSIQKLSATTVLFFTENTGDFVFDCAIPTHEWCHLACTFDGTTKRVFLNGTLSDSSTTGTGWTNPITTTQMAIGHRPSDNRNFYFDGYISNARIVKGNAVYTTNFTPSTDPLTAISGTSLLTCQDNRFVDNSPNGFTLSTTGTPKVVPFSPFAREGLYAASTNGGSGYFDGSGDWLSVPDSATFDLTGDLTIEAWVYPQSLSSDFNTILSCHESNDDSAWIFSVRNTGTVSLYGSGGNADNSTGTVNLNEWNHVAVSREGSTVRFFINGVLDASTYTRTGNYNCTAQGLGIGKQPAGSPDRYFDGNIFDARIVKGTALYTSSFTPPTAPLTDVSGTSLLCNFTNASIYDATGKNVLETVGNAQVDTTTVKYGTGAMEFDGSGDYLSIANTKTLDFGTGDFTVECWFNANSLSATDYAVLMGFHNSSNLNSWLGAVRTNGVFFYGSNATLTGGGTVLTNTWNHFAASRSGNTIRVFLNGVIVDSDTVSGSYEDGGYTFKIADDNSTNPPFNGYLDDLRITKGIARYTANFTPPTEEFIGSGDYSTVETI